MCGKMATAKPDSDIEPSTSEDDLNPREGMHDSVLDIKELFDLVTKKTFPKSWKGGNICYGLLKSLFDVVEQVVLEQGGRQDDMVKESLRILDDRIVFSSKFKVSNLKRTVNKKINSKKYSPNDCVDSLYGVSSEYVWDQCEKAGISGVVLTCIVKGESKAKSSPQVILTNEMVKELEWRKKNKLSFKDLGDCIHAISVSKYSMD